MALLGGKRKKKKEKEKKKRTETLSSKFVFAEPFVLMLVPASVKGKKLLRMIDTKARHLLGTGDYFYAYRKHGDQQLVLIVANTNWDGDVLHKDLEGRYPLLLHLKNGKYAVKGRKSYYNVTIDEDEARVEIYEIPMSGFVEPTPSDMLPPQAKLKWSLSSPHFSITMLAMTLVLVISVGFFSLMTKQVISARERLSRLRTQPQRRVVKQVKATVEPNVKKVLASVNTIGNKIEGVMYISRLNIYGGKRETFYLRCIKKGCLSPIPDASFDTKTGAYVVTEDIK